MISWPETVFLVATVAVGVVFAKSLPFAWHVSLQNTFSFQWVSAVLTENWHCHRIDPDSERLHQTPLL